MAALRILVAGCGYVGGALASRLAADGHQVFGLRRRPDGLPKQVHPIRADLADPRSMRGLPEGLSAVVYTAAADAPGEAAYRSAYVQGLTHLLEELARAGQVPRRVFFTSSTSVHGQHGGERVDETSPTDPGDHRGRILLEAESLLAAGPFPATVLRLGGIYGPGRTRLLESVREGTATYPAPGPHYTNRIHRDDAAGALRHLLGLEQPADLYLGVDDEAADRAQVLRWLAARLDAPQPRPAPTSDGDAGKRCSNARLRAAGYAFRYPTFREGYAALIESAPLVP